MYIIFSIDGASVVFGVPQSVVTTRKGTTSSQLAGAKRVCDAFCFIHFLQNRVKKVESL